MLTLMLLVACGGDDDGKGPGGGGRDDSGGGGGGDSANTDPDVSPEVTGVTRAECTTQQSAGEVWQIDFTCDDPQGADTISTGELSVVNAQGGVLETYATACNDGTCIGSFRADYDGITCSLEGTITFRLVVIDEDGNRSAPFDHPT